MTDVGRRFLGALAATDLAELRETLAPEWVDASGSSWVFEQHAFAEVGLAGIVVLDLVCSGDRAASQPEGAPV